MVGNILSRMQETGIVSIVRGIEGEKLEQTAKALYDGGIRCIEITFDTPGAAKMIEALKRAYGEDMLFGAGTVLDSKTARTAILAGADFILSPALCIQVVEMCNRYSKLAVPGVFTPTEILTAWQAGAQLVKVFPAWALGPRYIKDIKSPLGQVEIMAVGGITVDNAADFIKSGAISLGIGSELVNKKWVADGSFDLITQAAALFIEKVKISGRDMLGIPG